jgi:2-oxoisovalerate dehydrogenase E1 component
MQGENQLKGQATTTDEFSGVYEAMCTARVLDETEARLAQQGEAFFYIPGAGHEAAAALGPHLCAADWLHCHYRDKALALHRGVPAVSFLHALLSKKASNSGGRRMPGFPSDRALNIMSTPTLVANSALQSAGVAAVIREQPERPIVLCAVGDGSTQQGEFLEAVAEAVRACLPVLFLVEDNRYALSTPTAQQTFYSMPDGDPSHFYGLPIHRFDGDDAVALYEAFGTLVADMRADRQPRLVVLKMERLASHTNADDHTVYRSADDIAAIRAQRDPLKTTRSRLLALGMEESALQAIEQRAADVVAQGLVEARSAAEPEPCFDAKRPLAPELTDGAREYTGAATGRGVRMLEAMRETLRHQLATDPGVVLLGEDIADPKGDVFKLTQGLSTAFPGRVLNSALSESTIVGTAIGRALAGQTPVAFMQFADFMPLAYNQIASELGTMYWRTAGAWEAPVIIMAICGGYRPGLGPFHAQSPEALMAHIPGVDVYEPATAADAAGMLNAAFASRRPAVFFYPKSLLNDRDRQTSADVERHWVPIGRARRVRAGADLTLVCWGSTVPVAEQVAAALADVDVATDLFDLRCLFPWDQEQVTASARRTCRLLVIHEDNHTCGLGAEIVATVAAAVTTPLRVARVTRPDTYVPYHYGNQLAVLPSFRSVLAQAAELLDLDLAWQQAAVREQGRLVVNAIGSSPSDESVTINELAVAAGQSIAAGDLIAAVEADKASMDITAPVDGVVAELHAAVGDVLRVGTPLVTLAVEESDSRPGTAVADVGRPVLTPRLATAASRVPVQRDAVDAFYLSVPIPVLGSRRLTNQNLLDAFASDWTHEDVVQRTGIEERYWLGEGETVVGLAVAATRRLLDEKGLRLGDLQALICSTGTPPSMTPSLACRVLQQLGEERGSEEVQAHDVNAACAGYLYALQQATDVLRSAGGGAVLVLTAETLSRTLNPADPVTRFLFGDAATATLVTTTPQAGGVRLDRPVLSARGEPEKVLYVPFMDQPDDWLTMEGKYVFRVAVRKMVAILGQACAGQGVGLDELDLIVPHQANERIIDAIRRVIQVPPEKVFTHMRRYGNTSSNSIPLALSEVLPGGEAGQRIGLCAFGGGFTYGAALLEKMT